MRSAMPRRSRNARLAVRAWRSWPRTTPASSTMTTKLRLGSEANDPAPAPESDPANRAAASLAAPGPRLIRRTETTRRALPSTVTAISFGPSLSGARPSRSVTTTSMEMGRTAGGACGAARSGTMTRTAATAEAATTPQRAGRKDQPVGILPASLLHAHGCPCLHDGLLHGAPGSEQVPGRLNRGCPRGLERGGRRSSTPNARENTRSI